MVTTGRPSFHHAETGTPERLWRADQHWRQLPALTFTGVDGEPCGRLVVVAAHPDDETLGAGGLLSAAARADVPSTVVVATDGERSHPYSPTHSPAALARLRHAEAAQAAQILHPGARLARLRLPDGGLAGAVGTLEAALDDVVDADTLVVAPWREDGHPDHEAAGEAGARVAARTGARLIEYPVWLWHWGTPADVPWPRLLRFDLTPHDLAVKREAIGAHRTQISDLSPEAGDEPILTPRMLEHFTRGHEVFFGTNECDFARAFDAMFHGSDDPWQVDTSRYERRKRAATIAALPRARFGHALELGCSIGALAADIGARADAVLAVDASAEALRRAQLRHAAPHIRYQRARLPEQWPDGAFDLIVMSEVGYYCTRRELTSILEHTTNCLTPDGILLACHWRHPIEHWPLDGDTVHALLRSAPGLEIVSSHLEDDFRIDTLARPAPHRPPG